MRWNHIISTCFAVTFNLAAVAVFVCLSGPLLAEETPRWDVGLNAGASLPVENINVGNLEFKQADVFGTSPFIGGSAFYQIQKYVAVGLEANYETGHRIDFSGQGDPFGFGFPYHFDISNDANLHVFELAPVLKVGPWIQIGRMAAKPYLIGGVGWTHYWENDGTATYTADLPAPLPTLSSQSPAPGGHGDALSINGGGGMEFMFFNRLILGIEARYNRFFSAKSGSGDGQYVVPSGRVGIAF